MQLKLFFLGSSNKYSLDKVVFKANNQDSTIISKRGNGSSKNCSFKWSQGVRSLSLFFIEANKYLLSTSRHALPLLSGFQGSPAASLDYAISKQPIWMSEMFGSDSSGRLILTKLIRRENTELKRPGPVEIYLSSLAERELRLELYLDDFLLTEDRQLEDLALNLDSERKIHKITHSEEEKQILNESPSLNTLNSYLGDNTAKLVTDLVSRDINESLNKIDIFEFSKFNKYLDLVLNKKILIKEGLDTKGLISQIQRNNNPNNFLGIVTEEDQDYLKENISNITIKTNIWGSSTNAILNYLKIFKKLPLTIDYSQLHSHAIFKNVKDNRIKEEQPDIIILGLGGVLNLLGNKSEYELLLPSPTCSVTLLSSRAAIAKNKKRLPILVEIKERSTTGLFAMEEIEKRNPLIKPNEIKSPYNSYHEMFSMFKENEVFQTLLHYPHNEIAIKCNDAKPLYEGNLHSFFLIHKRISENKKLTHILNALIRDAWLTIRGQPELKSLLAKGILNDEEYVKRYERLSGLYQIA